MPTKIFVSQIDATNPDGTIANANSFIKLTNSGAEWVPIADLAAAGAVGYTGSAGDRGPTGYEGSEGESGPIGFQGSAGEQGETGYSGSQGDRGEKGYDGSVGFQGSAGYLGSTGYTGFTGSVGDRGEKGYDGSVGYTGSAGDVGYRGSAGETGSLDGILAFKQLQDVPQDYAGAAGNFVVVNNTEDGLEFSDTVYLTNNISTNVAFNGFQITNPLFVGFGEEVITLDGSVNPTINPIESNIYRINLDTPVTTITLNASGLTQGKFYYVSFILKQDGAGSRTVDWSGQTIYWPAAENIVGPEGPALSTEANYTDVVTLYTFNQGTYWLGVLSGKGFPTA